LSRTMDAMSDGLWGRMRYSNDSLILFLKISKSWIIEIPLPVPRLYKLEESISSKEFVIRKATPQILPEIHREIRYRLKW